MQFFVLLAQAGDVKGLTAAVLAGSEAFNQVRVQQRLSVLIALVLACKLGVVQNRAHSTLH